MPQAVKAREECTLGSLSAADISRLAMRPMRRGAGDAQLSEQTGAPEASPLTAAAEQDPHRPARALDVDRVGQ